MNEGKAGFETIDYAVADNILTITLNRPDKLNAFTGEMALELIEAFDRADADDEVRAIVVTGAGRAFCAGADIRADAEASASDEPPPEFIDVAARTDAIFTHFSKPVIAALNGVTCGGGLELAMMCDLIVAKRSAKIGDAHINFGMLPGGGATVRLPRLIGLMRARYLMYSGELWSAEEMERLGLVAKVFDDETFEADVAKLADVLAAKSPLALQRMKQLMNDGFDLPTEKAVNAEKDAVRIHMKTADAAEGMAAFAEKRPPRFRGY